MRGVVVVAMMDAHGTSLAAVLFDMDGTLIDSEKLWSLALAEVAAELGGSLSAETRLAMVGTDLVSSVQMLLDDIGSDVQIDVVQRLLVDATSKHFETSIEWRPGAQRLLHDVRAAGLPTALVTSTHRNLTSTALETIGRGNFDVIVCGDDVTNTKPHPEPYLTALAGLHADPARTVAIEDSPAGALSASAAGLATLVVPLEVPVQSAPLLTIVDSLEGITLDTLRRLLPA
jgi:HAD superfamily hydrolase (TIGR01509 family)